MQGVGLPAACRANELFERTGCRETSADNEASLAKADRPVPTTKRFYPARPISVINEVTRIHNIATPRRVANSPSICKIGSPNSWRTLWKQHCVRASACCRCVRSPAGDG